MVIGTFPPSGRGTALKCLLQAESEKHDVPVSFSVQDFSARKNPRFTRSVEVWFPDKTATQNDSLVIADTTCEFSAQRYLILSANTKDHAWPPNVKAVESKTHDCSMPIGYVQNNRIYFTYNLLGEGMSIEAVEAIFHAVMDALMPLAVQEAGKEVPESLITSFKGNVASSMESRGKELRNNIKHNELRVRELGQQITDYIRQNQQNSAQLKGLEELARDCEGKVEAQIKALASMLPHKIAALDVTLDRLFVYTHPIEIYSDEMDETFVIGEFKMEIPYHGDIQLLNLTKQDGDYHHPHVLNGTPCLGNITESVAKMQAEYEFEGLVLLMLQFLESHNKHGHYVDVTSWPTTSGEYISSREEDEDEDDWDACQEDHSPHECVGCHTRNCPYSGRNSCDDCWDATDDYSICIECGNDCPYRETAESRCRESSADCMTCNVDCSYARDYDGCHDGVEDEDVDCDTEHCDIQNCPYRHDPIEKPEEDEEEGGVVTSEAAQTVDMIIEQITGIPVEPEA